MRSGVLIVGLANPVAPVLNQFLLLILDQDVEDEGGVEMVAKEDPHEADTILGVQGLYFPVDVTHGVLEEASDILKSTESLGIIAGFLHVLHELSEVTVGFLGQSTSNHISALINVRHTIEETLDTSEALAQMRFGILTVVQIFSLVFVLRMRSVLEQF